MKKFIFYLIGGLLGISFLSAGQFADSEIENVKLEPREIIVGLRKFYSSHSRVNHELIYSLFSDHISKTPHSIETGVFIYKADVQYSQLGPIESLTTKTHTIGIDNEEKLIIISNHLTIPATNPMGNIEQLISDGNTYKIITDSGQMNAIEVSFESGEIEKAILWYNLQSFQPSRFILIYRKSIQLSVGDDSPFVQPRLEIEYRTTDFDELENDKLDTRTYLISSGVHWQLASQYRSYELVENIHELPDSN